MKTLENIETVTADITDLKVDAVVNAANSSRNRKRFGFSII
jgi:O-acetyl-ADP-ribose deacetylase (regulator of RNase III)